MAQYTQQRLDDLFNKYYESDLKNLCERYEELSSKYQIETKKNFRLLSSYPSDQTSLSVSALRSAIAKEIKAITPKEVVEGVKKRKLARKQKEMEKKKRKYQKSHGHVCKKCGGKDFLGIYHKYNDGGHCTLPSGKECDGYSPSFANICNSDQMLMDICVDCGTIFGLDVAELKRQIAYSDNNEDIRQAEGESSTEEVFDYGEEEDSESEEDASEEEEEYVSDEDEE